MSDSGSGRAPSSTQPQRMLTFYHFTRLLTIGTIYESGLRKGDIPLTLSTGFNAVWLTTDPDPTRFFYVDEANSQMKRAVRIKLQVSANDPNLKSWRDVAAMYKVSPSWYDSLHFSGGQSSEAWWVYRGKISNEAFLSCGVRAVNGSYTEYAGDNTLFEELMTNHSQVMMQSMLYASYPEPETGWPNRRLADRKCANPNCQEDSMARATLRCARCQGVQYHNKACQKAHWKEHKKNCLDPLQFVSPSPDAFTSHLVGQEPKSPYHL
jgi:hypothetical protein